MTARTWNGQTHPVAALFPMLSEDELADLADDIAANGLLEPIVLDQDGLLIDGRNRLAACRLAGVEPRFVQLAHPDPAGYIISLNLTRRHMTQTQRAVIAAEYPLTVNGSKAAVGRVFGVSRPLVSMAAGVLTYAPELRDGLMANSVSIREAYEEAQRRKEQAETPAAKLARLHEDAPDLADLVTGGTLTLAGATAELQARRQAAEAAEREARDHAIRASRRLASVLEDVLIGLPDDNLPDRFDASALTRPLVSVDASTIRSAGEALLVLAERWPHDPA
jgi:hypothetical protein